MAGKDDSCQSSGGGSRKTTPATKPQEQQAIIKCPRCDSSNTKFCYYNNYSLSQPRHFCKTCRRYWTNGGALRNVPIGGGCRKNKKMKSSTGAAGSRLSIDHSKDATARSLSEIGGLKYFQGIISPTIDFQLGGGLNNNYPRVINSSSNYNNDQLIPSFGDISMSTGPVVPNPCFNQLDPSASSSSNQMGFTNFPFSTTYQSNLASSIESLSSMNQDLHYKLQQQRMAMLLNADNSQKEIGFSSSGQTQKPQPILFHNLEASRTEGSLADHLSRKEVGSSAAGNLATEWFFDPTPTSSSTGINENGSTTWNGIQAWSNLNQFSPLP